MSTKEKLSQNVLGRRKKVGKGKNGGHWSRVSLLGFCPGKMMEEK